MLTRQGLVGWSINVVRWDEMGDPSTTLPEWLKAHPVESMRAAHRADAAQG